MARLPRVARLLRVERTASQQPFSVTSKSRTTTASRRPSKFCNARASPCQPLNNRLTFSESCAHERLVSPPSYLPPIGYSGNVYKPCSELYHSSRSSGQPAVPLCRELAGQPPSSGLDLVHSLAVPDWMPSFEPGVSAALYAVLVEIGETRPAKGPDRNAGRRDDTGRATAAAPVTGPGEPRTAYTATGLPHTVVTSP